MAKKAYKYLGTGEFYTGIPARDLTADDFAALGEIEQEVVKAGDLYKDLAPAEKPKDEKPQDKDKDKEPAK